jgi:membrane glycosyltransferase
MGEAVTERPLPPAAPARPAPVPPAAPLPMPAQCLREAPEARFERQSPRVHLARLVAFGGAIGLTVFGAREMAKVFEQADLGVLQTALLVLVTLTFGWIAFSATSALAGIFFAPRPERAPNVAPIGRTAIVMPVYNEDPAATAGALAAMGRGLADMGHGDAFEIFILSDTRDSELWLRETAVFAALRERLAGRMAVWYRRRPQNPAKKAGNLQDFVERWGRRYDYFLSLDADSIMAPETIIEMTRRMASEPRLALLQTLPTLAGGTTLYARLQQFAGRLYGPVVARGVAAWQGEDGNYWGHNALVRTAAFAESAGLPELRGRAPFGGHVLSHDFVEAALLRRSGWIVRMDPDLAGSWEGAPPSLATAADRDRRWAQGNLQHLKVIGAAGLRWPNRVHFLIGVSSYLASPLWLAMIAVGLVLSARAIFIQPEYFPNAYHLFPQWPRFDAVRMRWLFAGSMALLLFPKLVGLISALVHAPTRRRFGGIRRLIPGTFTEILLSALYAPIMMLMQTRQLIEILAGADGGWAAQSRNGSQLSWAAALARHWRHLLIGLAVGGSLLYAAPPLLLWLSPVLAGLILAPWLARLSGDPAVGDRFATAGLLAIPEESAPDPILIEAKAENRRFEPLCRLTMRDLVALERARAAHAASLTEADAEGVDHLDAITARAKIAAAPTAEDAVTWLTELERRAVLALPELLTMLSDQKRMAPADFSGFLAV